MREILGATLASVHNISWFHQFMAAMRESILDGSFDAFRARVHELYPERTGSKPGRSSKKKRPSRRRR